MTELPDRLLRDVLDDTASTTRSMPCVDAGTLAAWADGTLTEAGRAAIETHAADCARCLALLAAITRIEPVPIAPPWWRRSPIAWLLPLTAAAAGVVIVVRLAVLEQRPAVSQPAAAPATAVSQPGRVPQAPSAPAQPPATTLASQAPAPAKRQKPGPIDVEPGRAESAPQEAAAAESARAAPAPSATPVPPSTQVPASAPVPPSTPPSVPAPAAAPSLTAAAPSPATPAQQVVTSAARDQAAGGRGGGGSRAFAAQTTTKAAGASPPVPILIESPDRHSQWRIVGDAVEHTEDGGATWQPQPIGVVSPVRAGAAPDARVCWIAGAGGVVLRTSDGTTWTRIPFPERADLVAVQASDASHAVVTTADGRRFATTDGGGTWTLQS